jgi:hypothetical protein
MNLGPRTQHAWHSIPVIFIEAIGDWRLAIGRLLMHKYFDVEACMIRVSLLI